MYIFFQPIQTQSTYNPKYCVRSTASLVHICGTKMLVPFAKLHQGNDLLNTSYNFFGQVPNKNIFLGVLVNFQVCVFWFQQISDDLFVDLHVGHTQEKLTVLCLRDVTKYLLQRLWDDPRGVFITKHCVGLPRQGLTISKQGS